MELLKLLSTNEIVAQLISFLILLFLLRAFAWKRILAVLDERRQRIAAEQKNIEDAKHSVGALQSEYEEKLRSIERAAKEKMQEAIAEGRKLAEEIKKEARQEAARIAQQTKEDAQQAVIQAKEQLKDEIVDLVLDATGHLLEEKITEEDDRRMIRDYLRRVKGA